MSESEETPYERAKWFLRRRGLDKLAEVPELLLAMNEYAEEVKRELETANRDGQGQAVG